MKICIMLSLLRINEIILDSFISWDDDWLDKMICKTVEIWVRSSFWKTSWKIEGEIDILKAITFVKWVILKTGSDTLDFDFDFTETVTAKILSLGFWSALY